MTHRDQLRLAIEMQNGIVDRFVEARMAHMDVARLFGLTEESRLLAWLYQSTVTVGSTPVSEM